MLVLAVLSCDDVAPSPVQQRTALRSSATKAQTLEPSFGELLARLSEPEQAFFSDNLVSNESSYLQAALWLEQARPTAGGYIGVGPEQNLSYIALLRPQLAFIVDIRRDNLLLHLLYKHAFERAETRARWLALMLSRELEDSHPSISVAETAQSIVERVAAAPRLEDGGVAHALATLEAMKRWNIDIRSDDERRLVHLMRAFSEAQLGARFESTTARPDFPTLGELLVAHDPHNRPKSFLSSFDGYRFLRELQARHRIIPVTGDLAGKHAMAEVAKELRRRELRVSIVYASNVEQYLLMDERWHPWRDNLERLPRTREALLIRSHSDRRAPHPAQKVGSWVTLSQPLDDVIAQHAPPASYRELALRSRSAAAN